MVDEIGDTSTPPSSGEHKRPLRIAVQGCCHGALDRIYATIEAYDAAHSNKPPIDLLLCCGDFQALRNSSDLDTIAVPPKYREMGSFYKYYSGQVKAPVLTLFIGGNHEASGYLQELFYGGWVAPNIYYLGAAGIVNFGGVRIAGLSGIFKSHDFEKGRFEFPPYDNSSLRSVYHVRNVEVYRLKCIQGGSKGVDVMISHDWPRGIEQYGDTAGLIRKKKFFQKEIEENCLGSPVNEEVLHAMKPRWWFAAHLHVKFTANVLHESRPREPESNLADLIPSQIKQKPEHGEQAKKKGEKTSFVGLESATVCPGSGTEDLVTQMTKFLSLDKCLPRRHHLQIVNIARGDGHGSSAEPKLEYDLEWLAVLKKTHYLTKNTRSRQSVPDTVIPVSSEDMDAIRHKLRERLQRTDIKHKHNDQDVLTIPENFVITATPHGLPDAGIAVSGGHMIGNPQTDELLSVLGLDHIVTTPYQGGNTTTPCYSHHQPTTQDAVADPLQDENEIDLCEDEEEYTDENGGKSEDHTSTLLGVVESSGQMDNNEIDIDESDDAVTGGANAKKKPRTNSL
mmetsp:Transcript_45887/g.139359  ORF Transcript_45887/g.139359 Transcript_45887/m.139359 type:complete len:565 (-) Transcript_45887:91-1785(-)